MQESKIQLLDSILRHFYEQRLNNVAPINIWKMFTDNSKEFYLLIVALDADNLIYKSSPKTYSNPAMNMYRITSTGIKVVEAGGIEATKKKHLEKQEKQEIMESMEYEKLSNEIYDLTNRVRDYGTVKRQAFWGLILAGLAVLIALLTFIYKK